jgi:hypothetical protein
MLFVPLCLLFFHWRYINIRQHAMCGHSRVHILNGQRAMSLQILLHQNRGHAKSCCSFRNYQNIGHTKSCCPFGLYQNRGHAKNFIKSKAYQELLFISTLSNKNVDIVRTTRFWNNHHQVCAKQKACPEMLSIST